MMRFTWMLLLLLAVGGCDLLSGKAAESTDSRLYPLQIAIEGYGTTASGETDSHEPADSHPSGSAASELIVPLSAAVLAVVDSTALAAAATEEPAEGTETDALRRERLVRQAINGSLVANSLIDVVQPDQDSMAKARAEIIANNSAALSTPLASELGGVVGAEILVCALIDQLGTDVNIVAQSTADGKLVYQDTLTDWEVLTGLGQAAGE